MTSPTGENQRNIAGASSTPRRDAGVAVSIATAIGLIALVGTGLSLSLPLLSLEMERMGVSGSGIGLNTAVAGLAAFVAVPFVPAIAQRFGIGRVIAAALLASIAALLLFLLVTDYYAWFGFRFLLSVGLGTLFVLSEYWIASTAPAARRGVIMGIYATVLSLGFATGPALLALVGTAGPAPYLAGVALFVAAGFPLWLARRNLPVIDAAPSRSIGHSMIAVPLASMAGLASGAIETAGIALLPVFGIHRGLDATSAALLVSCVALGNVVSQVPLGLLSDRMSKARLLALLGGIGLVVTAAIPLFAGLSHAALFALLFIWGGIAGGLYTVGLAHLASRQSGADLAGGNAAFVLLFNGGLLVGPPMVGAAMDASRGFGFAGAMAVFFALVLAAAVIETREKTVPKE